jgi:hypothetical protein
MIGLVRLIVFELTRQLTALNIEEVVATIWELQERMTDKMDAWLKKLEVN